MLGVISINAYIAKKKYIYVGLLVAIIIQNQEIIGMMNFVIFVLRIFLKQVPFSLSSAA